MIDEKRHLTSVSRGREDLVTVAIKTPFEQPCVCKPTYGAIVFLSEYPIPNQRIPPPQYPINEYYLPAQ